MTFKDYLVEKNIPFKEEGEDIFVEDLHLMPYMDEVLAKFPELDFDFKIDDFDMDDLADWDDIDLEGLTDLNDLDDWDDDDLDDEDWEEYWKEEEEE